MSNTEFVLRSKFGLSETQFENISQYLSHVLLINKQNDLIIDNTNNVSLNGQKIYDLSEVIANSLINEYQLNSGDIVCFFCPNNYFQILALIAFWRAGAVCLFINEKANYDEIENIYIKTHFKYLFCGTDNEKIASKLWNNYNDINKPFIVAEESYESDNSFHNIKQLFKTNGNKTIAVKRCSTDSALIEITGGTNDGIRKPVIKTHSNLIQSVIQMQNEDILANNSDDIIISIPFDKLFGISFFLNCLISGSKTVINNGTFETDSTSYLESIEKYKVNKLIVFSSDIELMVKNEVNLLYNISSVKEIIYFGLFDDYNQMRLRVENMFKCRYFRCVYGTTESGVISCLYKSKSFQRNSYSLGQLIPGTELKIIDVITGESLSAHRLGEICVKSKQLSSGYLGISTTDSFTSDGYFKTNDFGYYDSDGNVYIESRVSDIVSIDEQIHCPNELEILLKSNPNVIGVTVVGTYCHYSDDESDNDSDEDNKQNRADIKKNGDKKTTKQLNNTFKVFVVLKAGSDVTDLDLINYINDRVDPIKQIDFTIFMVDVLPTNPLGIIRRSALIKY